MLLKIRGCKNRWWWEDCFYHYCWLNANIHTTTTTTTIITSWISHNIKTPCLISWKECQHSSQGRKRVVNQVLFHYHVVTELRLWPLLCYSIWDPHWSLWLKSCPSWRYLRFLSDNTMHRMQMKQRNTVLILLLILGLGCSILHAFSPSSATDTVLVKSFKVIQISNKLLHLLLIDTQVKAKRSLWLIRLAFNIYF